MFTLTLDRGTEAERSVLLDQFSERPIRGSFTGAASIRVEKAEDIPDVRRFAEKTAFETVEAVNGEGVEIPISGRYDTIADFTMNYDDARRLYSVSLALGRGAE